MQYTCAPTPKDRALFEKNLLPLVQTAKAVPFGITVGDRSYHGFGKTPTTEKFEISDANAVRRTFVGKLRREHLEITVETLEYKDYPAIEWVVYLKNTGKTPSSRIRNFVVADGARLASPNAKLHHNTGDGFTADGYRTEISPLLKDETMEFAPADGRSCDGAFPYYRIESPTFGYNLAIGWGGMWKAAFTGGNNHTRVTVGQHDCDFFLNPGEVVRTPRIAIECYDGKTERGVNLWRRFYMAHVMPKWKGEALKPLVVMHDAGTGEEFTMANTRQQLNAIDVWTKKGMKFDLWWIDAGWYPCYVKEVDRKVWTRTADWSCDPDKWEHEFTEVSDKVHSMGARLLVWFEPERMCRWHMPGVMPEEYAWYLKKTDENGKEYVDETALFKMGDDKARKWMSDKINALIKRNKIDVYRQDFNMGPLNWWRQNDEPGRSGIIENHHVQGYNAYWDSILDQNDGILIDSCASGGRRNDYDTMKRAVPFHYTDYGYGEHAIKESFTYTMFGWIPYFRNHTMSWDYTDGKYHPNGDFDKTGTIKKMSDLDNYAYHTAFAPAITCYATTDISDEEAEYCTRMNDLFYRAAKFTLAGDYYPLSPYSKSRDSWYVLQFHSEKEDAGVINAVRNLDCEEEAFLARPRQIDEKAIYVFECPETNETFEMSGRELAKKGLSIALPKRSGRYFFYHKKVAE